ncbi:MAG TPA: hypothetical protein VH720_04695 [Candidatus Limnocylindrales bacterium]|jgi:hypothetical protein
MKRRRSLPVVLAVLALAITGAASMALAGVGDRLDRARDATRQFKDLAVATDAGYGKFYVCTDNEGVGGMGQHYVNGDLVADPRLRIRHPEVLVYEPTASGGSRLVAVEYVVFQADWDALHPNPPKLFGRTLALLPAGNRYGLPAFYELHVWLFKSNPLGRFNDWNPRVSCRGQGDPA